MSRLVSMLLMSLFALPVCSQWFPLEMWVDGKLNQYQPPKKASRPWRLCALLPHAKDHYWWGVAWGLSEEAQRLGVEIGIYNAGGYDQLEVQKQQLHDCQTLKADAFIIAAISADGLNQDVARLSKKGYPVIDLVNGMDSDKVSSRSLVSFAEMTRAAVDYMLGQDLAKPIDVGWFPGPQDARWVQEAEAGLNAALKGQSVTLHHGGYGSTESFVQADLVRKMVHDFHPRVILANAVAATVAGKYFTEGIRGKTKVIAFYSNPQTIALVQSGNLEATVTDSPVIQARVAVDLAVQWLDQGQAPKRVSPVIEVLTSHNFDQSDISRTLAPNDQWMIHRSLSPLDAPNKKQ